MFPVTAILIAAPSPKYTQLALFKNVREILHSQVNNPVLNENKRCLAYWQNAISVAENRTEVPKKIISYPDTVDPSDILAKMIFEDASLIYTDVGKVYSELIMSSDDNLLEKRWTEYNYE